MLKNCPPDKILNVKTNRCVLKTGTVGKNILKEQKPKEKSTSTSTNKTSSSLKSYDYLNSSNKIKRFIDYDIIKKYLKDVKIKSKECITPYKISNKYLLTNNLILYKKIGSKSVYGVIYKCKNRNKSFSNIPVFTAKLQLKTSAVKREVSILTYLSNFAIKYKVPNLPIIYKSIECNKIYHNDKSYPDILANASKNHKNYSLILNELAAGDLHNFLNYKYYNLLTIELWRNLYEQIFISLAILHSLGINHNDSHDGNFLYHKIKPGGCFHYKINNIDYYIKNLGFLWTSWDYGIAGKLYNQTSYIYDYMSVNSIFRKDNISEYTEKFKNHPYYKNFKHWGYLHKKVNVPPQIELLQYLIWDCLEKTKPYPDVELMNKKITEDLWLKHFRDSNLLFSKTPCGNILSSVVINFKPFTGNGRYDTDEYEINRLLQ